MTIIGVPAWVHPMSFASRLGPYVWRDLHLITHFDPSATGLRQCVREGYPCHTCRPNFAQNESRVPDHADAWVWWHRLHNVVNTMKGKPTVPATHVRDLQPYCNQACTLAQWETYYRQLEQECKRKGSWYPGFIVRMNAWAGHVRTKYEL